MMNKKLVNKIFSLIFALSFVLWLGTYISRQLVLFQLFEPQDLSLRSLFKNIDLNPLFYAIYPIIISNLSLYLILLISLIIFLFTTNYKLKENGWLLISSIIIFITAPFELFLMLKDLKLIKKILEIPNIDYYDILTGFKERITILSNFALIEIFSYLIIIYLIIFRPLQKKQ